MSLWVSIWGPIFVTQSHVTLIYIWDLFQIKLHGYPGSQFLANFWDKHMLMLLGPLLLKPALCRCMARKSKIRLYAF